MVVPFLCITDNICLKYLFSNARIDIEKKEYFDLEVFPLYRLELFNTVI